jgi:hypothetical protein
MTSGPLPSHLEVSALLRRAEASGDFGTVMRKGDPDRGAILLCITQRGRHITCLERLSDMTGGYQWRQSGPPESASSIDIDQFLAKRTRVDADFWAIELDIAEPERFIAETTAVG